MNRNYIHLMTEFRLLSS